MQGTLSSCWPNCLRVRTLRAGRQAKGSGLQAQGRMFSLFEASWSMGLLG